MSTSIRIGTRRISGTTALIALLVLSVAGALLTPEESESGGGYSSYSVGPTGTRIAYELAQRMGWSASRRETPLASSGAADVQVVVGPQSALGAHEAHDLLSHVRRGGGLVFTIDEAPELADSIGLVLRGRPRALVHAGIDECPAKVSFTDRRAALLAPSGRQIAWRRPAPGPVTELAVSATPRGTRTAPLAIGFPLGAGRIAAISSADLLINGALRVCSTGADLLATRALEYARPATAPTRVAFDEFHHGRGLHGGSMTAMWMFLSRTATGRFLAQVLIAALLLLFAAAPRPIVPRDPEQIARRSPLEHADALSRAYADVGATRTATSRLVDGVRRRVGRVVPSTRTASHRAFLAAAEARLPSLAPSVSVVRQALDDAVPLRTFPAVGDAIAAIERALGTSTTRT